jgi:hypothetical protein
MVQPQSVARDILTRRCQENSSTTGEVGPSTPRGDGSSHQALLEEQ